MSSSAGKPVLVQIAGGKLVHIIPAQQLAAIQLNVPGHPGVSVIPSQEAAGAAMISSPPEASLTSIRPLPTGSAVRAPPTFFMGDLVKMTPQFAALKGQSQDAVKMLMEAIGIVQLVAGPTVVALFNGLEKRHWSSDSSSFIKLNAHSVNQLIQIRSDDHTAQEIKKQFEKQSENLKGAIGQVTGIDEADPTRVFVLFDDADIYDWLPKFVSLPSSWMDVIPPTNSLIDKERLNLASKLVALFFRAVEVGDLRSVKLLYSRHGVDAEARNPAGKTALHLASQMGHKELIYWLLDEAQIDVDQPDSKGYRAIHFAIHRCNTEILEILLGRGAEVDSQTNCGKTALHIAVLKESTDCIDILMDYDADPNLQDEDGNTALHVAILHGNDDVLNELTSNFNFQFGLRNKNGFNIIQLAVKMNDFGSVEFFLGDKDMCDPLLEWLPNGQSTVLHYVCTTKNFRMAKLLVDEAKGWIMLDRLPLLGKLLEAKNERGETALLIACQNKDFALVELLVEAGADVKAVDQDGNTTILLAASSIAPDDIPTKDKSPSIFKVYEGALVDSTDTKLMMERHPILSLIAYLMAKGSSLEAVNKTGKSGTAAVLSKGSPSIIVKTLFKLLFKSLGKASTGSTCMGRKDCTSQPVFHLYCPHKPSFKACSKCFLLNSEKLKCKCPEEDVASISPAGFHGWLDLSRIREQIPPSKSSGIGFNWIQDGSKSGFLQDTMGSRYRWSGTRKDGSVGYRCDKEGCRAVARRIKLDEGKWAIRLEAPHEHLAGLKRKMSDELKMIEGGNSSSQPATKKERSSTGENCK